MPTNQQHDGSGDNVAGDKIVVESPKLFSEKVLTQLPEKNEVFIGRKQESLDILEKMSKADIPLVLVGIGGVGKTALLNEIFNKNYEEYEKAIYIEIKDDFKSSFISAFSTFKPKSSDKEKSFQELMSILSNITENVFMVIDNISRQKDYNLLKKLPSNYKIVVTSRIELSSNTYKVDVLSKELAQKLFFHYHDVSDVKSLDILLEYIGYHTLFIELTAKVLEENSVLSVSTILDDFMSGKLSKLTLTDLDTGKEKGLNEYLGKLFDMSILSPEDISLLRKFSLLHSTYFHQDILKKFLVEEDINKKLLFLSKKGWVLKTKYNYKLHEIIKKYIISNYKPDYEVSKDVIKYFDAIVKIHFDNAPSALLESTSLATYLLLMLEFENYEVALFKHTVSQGLREIGNYSLALQFIEEAIKYSEKELGGIPELSTFYNHLGYVYQDLDKTDKSIIALEKSVKLEKKKNELDYHVLSISYNTLAVTYRKMYDNTRNKQYKIKAKYFIDLAIEIRENKIENDPDKLGYVYNNASSIYSYYNMKKAIQYAEKTIELREKIYPANHPKLASTYNNMGFLLSKNKDYDNAILYYKKSEEILISNYGKNHPRLYINYSNLAQDCIEIGDKENARKYITLGINIAKEFLDIKHPHMKNFKLLETLINSEAKSQSKKTPRNSKCECGSGLKYKQCCGKF